MSDPLAEIWIGAMNDRRQPAHSPSSGNSSGSSHGSVSHLPSLDDDEKYCDVVEVAVDHGIDIVEGATIVDLTETS
jgi:hypothetical protein